MGSRNSRRRATHACLLISAVVAVAGFAPAEASAATRADFGVDLSGPTSARLGEDVTYTVTVTNNGPDAWGAKGEFKSGERTADGTVVSYSIDVTSVEATQGSCSILNDGARCDFGNLAPGGQATMTVVVRIDQTPIDFQAFARQDAEEVPVDFNYSNDYEHMDVAIPNPVKLTGLPRGCAKQPFAIHLQVKAAHGLKTKLAVDNRPLVSSTKPRFDARIDPDKLGKGTHTLKISIPDKSGPPLYKDTKKFKTC